MFSESKLASSMISDIERSVVFLELKKRLLNLGKSASLVDYLNLRKGQSLSARQLVKELFSRAGFERILIDESYRPGEMLNSSEFEAVTGVKVSRIARIEPILEMLIGQCASAEEVESRLERSLFPPRDKALVALKTIVCYRGGLSIYEVDRDDALANFADCRRDVISHGRIRRSSYYHHLLLKAFDLAIARDLPVQVHCGLGDDDADLSLSNPDLLHRLLRKPRFSSLKLVLLHCYPFQKEAAILASLYPHVYFDLSLASFLLAEQGQLYSQVLASAPYSKILAGTDGHSQPETYHQGAMALRQGLSSALWHFEQKGSISRDEAGQIENAVLHGNARQLYRL
ncbi:MAG: amidohydrolase family protein [Cyanobacteria bacterium REEB67]|nr:amidohydrolase family protein [Cyanobacteria bacterium REEB67]